MWILIIYHNMRSLLIRTFLLLRQSKHGSKSYSIPSYSTSFIRIAWGFNCVFYVKITIEKKCNVWSFRPPLLHPPFFLLHLCWTRYYANITCQFHWLANDLKWVFWPSRILSALRKPNPICNKNHFLLYDKKKLMGTSFPLNS